MVLEITDPVIYPTTGDDVLIGGTGDTEFSYDFNSDVIGK